MKITLKILSRIFPKCYPVIQAAPTLEEMYEYEVIHWGN